MTDNSLYAISPLQFSVKGKVIHGDKIGRTIGFPTANLKVNTAEINLGAGVYLCEVNFNSADQQVTKYGLAYYGPRLIFGEMTNSFEVFIYDFDQEIYGIQITVTTSHFMRPPLQINSLEELKNQLQQDKEKGLELLNNTIKDLWK